MNELHTKKLFPRLFRKDMSAESRAATPTKVLTESRPSTSYPTRPSTSSRPSSSLSRKGVQYVNRADETCESKESAPLLSCDSIKEESFNLDLTPAKLLSLSSTSPEIVPTIFTSTHENRVVITYRYNYGLSMVLEPDFDPEIQINF